MSPPPPFGRFEIVTRDITSRATFSGGIPANGAGTPLRLHRERPVPAVGAAVRAATPATRHDLHPVQGARLSLTQRRHHSGEARRNERHRADDARARARSHGARWLDRTPA